MARLAFFTVGVMQAAWGEARVQGFVDRVPATFAAAGSSPGFVARVVFEGEEPRPARYADASYEGRVPQTLSIWRDLDSVYAFSYSGVHGEALRHRHDWFEPPVQPTHVAWWVPDDGVPTWREAFERYDGLCQDGPTPRAFTLHSAFGPGGQTYKVEKRRLPRADSPSS
jgi:hypothetical protein